jgi:UDP-N-acetylglucosamine/UDP-N-acetylgalactosamine diphosphorylase
LADKTNLVRKTDQHDDAFDTPMREPIMTQASTQTERYQQCQQTLRDIGQGHILQFFDQLDAQQQDQLLSQIEAIDWQEVAKLIDSHVKQKPKAHVPEQIDPAPYYPHQPSADLQGKYDQARQRGEQLLQQGKVAAFTVAGGQGTRLGWDGPKGTFPATPIRQLPLFGCMAEYLINAQQRYGATIPWYIMTSPANDAATRQAFEAHDYFGLDPKQVMFFPQQMMPAIDMQSHKVLLADQANIALSPNGHGGSLKALYTSGALDDMQQRGIEQISYTQVDNPLVRMVDPLFIGLHDLDQAQMSSKMLPKRGPKEKLGNFCLVDGRVQVIEYSDLPEELAEQRLDDGSLRFTAGSIAIHVIHRDFVTRLNEQPEGFGLPWHRAEKKVAHFDFASEATIKPDSPNAVKLETFVFDALPMCESSIVYETDRTDEFAPIKNADTPAGEAPASDSAESSKLIQTERAGRWLEANGVSLPRDQEGAVEAVIEIAQTTAIYPDDLRAVDLPSRVGPGEQMLL